MTADVNEKAPHRAGLAGTIQREIDRINAALNDKPENEVYDRLYAAQQALSWALDPSGAKSPFDMVMGIQAETEGYRGCPDLGSS